MQVTRIGQFDMADPLVPFDLERSHLRLEESRRLTVVNEVARSARQTRDELMVWNPRIGQKLAKERLVQGIP